MGILSRAGDLTYTLRFLRLLTTKFEDTTAYKLGLIDKDGNKLRKPETSEEKSAYNLFHRLVFNLKKLLAKVPGGKSQFASYASALLLLKEKLDFSDETIERIVEETGFNPLEFLSEETSWMVTKDHMLSPGLYRITENKVVNSTCEELCKAGDTICIEMDCYPVATVMGIDIYEGTHIPTNQQVYVAAGELDK